MRRICQTCGHTPADSYSSMNCSAYCTIKRQRVYDEDSCPQWTEAAWAKYLEVPT
jgi:hypothetical protein